MFCSIQIRGAGGFHVNRGLRRASVIFSMEEGASMGKLAKLAAVAAMPAMIAASAAAEERTQVGELRCDVSGGVGLIVGSQQTLNCTFLPAVPGPAEHYIGTLTKLGVDIGVSTGGVMVWTVVAPTDRRAGALAGSYGGATAEATLGAGGGANVLLGGSNRTIQLQPLSLESGTGLNLAAGVAGIDLRWVK
jgi:hypothetical protein